MGHRTWGAACNVKTLGGKLYDIGAIAPARCGAGVFRRKTAIEKMRRLREVLLRRLCCQDVQAVVKLD